MGMFIDIVIDIDMSVHFGKPSLHQYVAVLASMTLIQTFK